MLKIFENIETRKTVREQAEDVYRPKPKWASMLTDEEWCKAIEGLPKGRVWVEFFTSKDLPF